MMATIDQAKQVIANTYGRFPIVFESGSGVTLKDDSGKTYLDFVAGIAVNALGYGDEGYAEALKEQALKMCHVSNLYWNAQNIALSEKLTKWSGLSKAFYCNSGAEANEAALKFARLYGEDTRYEIITMANSFHGRTMGALTMTGQTKYQKHFSPLIEGVKYVPYNDSEALKEAVGDQTVAIMVEVIQGEGGIVTIAPAFVETIKSLCKTHDLLLIVDEVQTGIARTGHYFGYQAFGLEPDIVSVAKGVAGGFPMGVSLVSERVASKLSPSCHASTFGGSALGSAAANYVLNKIDDENMLAHVNEMGDVLKAKLEELKGKYSIIKELKGMGLIQGILIDDALPTSEIIGKAIEEGLLLVGAGHQVIRFVPPLIVKAEDIEAMGQILDKVLASLTV
ncbi:aspartate aminotransferase family protein [Fusibacter paucivorans]|uniref:Acetylornithine aminotransferase n=2 Tax=Fusibacter paucivorans TaxID=76009 RepID=A0ABS5PL40_9FIRM|nr:aspartate aminotransferase family protein [Fusibacter paucivorans]